MVVKIELVKSGGGIQLSEYLCVIRSGGQTYSADVIHGLRPVFHLKSDIKVTGGSGTEEDPYTLGV